jgi:hypothetical protein
MSPRIEFDPALLDKMAEQMYVYDCAGLPPRPWADSCQSTYLELARIALQAACDNAKVEDQFVVRGRMPIEGHSDYGFNSDVMSTLEEAEKLRAYWADRYGANEGVEDEESPTFTIEHTVKVLANTYRYWTQAEVDAIQARAKERAEKFARYAASDNPVRLGEV